MLKALLFIAAIALFGGYAWAGAPIYGEGNESCGTWTANRHTGGNSVAALAAGAWVRGFITAGELIAHAYHWEEIPDTDAGAMNGWMDNYCAAHPLEKIAVAVIKLRTALIQQVPAKQ